ncbi:MAG: DUF1588 domain-containing protein [Verrucomicrobiota bacterium]
MRCFPSIFIFLLSATSLGIAPASALDHENHPGKAIYQRLCLDCHGKNGAGTEDYPDVDPLVGNRSIESLTGKIHRTMPEDNEEACVDEDARLVAEYIYHAFYSPTAQNRGESITTDLTRLTSEQIKHSVADLIGGFRNVSHPPVNEKPGLRAHYTLDDRKRAGNSKYQREKFDRVDPKIQFDYGESIPELPEGLKTEMTQFNIDWTGSIVAKKTGWYEFTLRTRNGAKLYVNEHDRDAEPTIDAWVAPDNEVREETGKIFLLGGRRYFVRLEYFKYKEKKALIELLWKPPHGTRHVVPPESLTPDFTDPAFVGETRFPADDRSFGYERGSTISRVWLDAVNSLAFEAADFVVANIDRLAEIKRDDGKSTRAKKIHNFAITFTERAMRRPLKPGEKAIYVDPHFRKVESEEDSIRRVVLRSLTAPQFLYPATAFEHPRGPWAKISALALATWDSVPDRRLIKAIEQGKLDDPKKLEQLAWDIQWDGRARHKVTGFFHQWLELDKAEDLAKDTKLFPQFNDEMVSDLRTSLELFIDDVVWSEASDYRQLLLADHLYLNGRLGKIYGKPGVKGEFEKVSFEGGGRNGVITHPFLLTAFSYHNNTSPIHRGVFLTRNIVGLSLKPPPEAIEFKDNDFPPNLTMREKVTELTRAKACMSCHSMINPLGFSLEHYDAIGRWRAKEQNKPINDDGILETDDGDRIEIKGPRDVAEYAANSPSAHEAFVRQLFHHVNKQPVLAYGHGTADELEDFFRNHGHNIRHLLVRMAMKSTEPIVPES